MRRSDPCHHIISSIIAIRKARSEGLKVPKPKNQKASVGYRFTRKDGSLHFERVVQSGRKSFVLSSSLLALASGRIVGPRVNPTREDVAIDHFLGENRRGILPTKILQELVEKLANFKDVKLDGKTISTSSENTGFMLCIDDDRGGFKVYGQQDPGIKEVFRNGVALCRGKLRPINNAKLSPAELRLLAEGKFYSSQETVELVSEVIPSLGKKLTIKIKSKKLPGAQLIKPKIQLVTKRRGSELTVSPRIVYGDPVIAYLDGQKLISKGKEIPQRSLELEKQLQAKLQSRFSFELNSINVYRGPNAVDFVSQLGEEWHASIQGKAASFFEHKGELKPDLDIKFENSDPYFQLEFKTKKGSTTEALKCEPNEVFKAWEQGESMVPLIDGGWANIPKDWLETYGQKISELMSARKEDGTIPKCMLNDVSELCRDLSIPVPKELISFQKACIQRSEIPESKLPEGLIADLRPYQKEGIDWLQNCKSWGVGALLADDMGLGKTLQTICILSGKSIVIAPTSVLYNWNKEINKFRPDLKVCVSIMALNVNLTQMLMF